MLTYGNGLKVKYEYDALDRIEKIQYNIGTNKAFVDVYSYEYYADGKLYTVTDHVLDEMTQYIYDAAGKLTGTTLFDVSGQATEQYASNVHYDSRDRLSQVEFDLKYRVGTTTVQDTRFNFYYYLENDRLQTYHTAFADTMINVAPVYDSFGRVQSRTVTGEKSNVDAFYNKISYQFISSGNNQSALVSQYKSETGKTSSTATETVFNYTYDANGNITRITDASGALLYQYYYDELGQLDQERNAPLGYIYSWVYDDSGNITAKRTFSYTNGTVGSLVSTINYTYGNSAWGDQLTKYGNTSITYDSIGNPITIGSDTLSWQGRQLMSHTVDEYLELTYEYNADGIRTYKKVYDLDMDDYSEHEYILNGTQIVAEIIDGNITLIYLYDENGSPIGMKYRTRTYAQGVFDTFFFEKNLQGDVIGVYDSTGTKLITYTYDAWGNFRTTYATSGSGALGKAVRNPFRYRGYYYDGDTGWYYLQTRYYNPVWGRFINADSVIAGVSGSIQGYNMFAYCFNNSVNMSDSSGHWPQWMKKAACWVNNNIIQPVANFFSPSTNTISGQFQEGILRGSGSLTGGYSEINGRLQINSKDSKIDGMLGGFAKVSTGNASGKIGVGNNNVALSLKGVGDGLTATAQAGIQYKNGAGLAAKAKAAVLTGRVTAELELFGWQIEFGVSGDLLSVGAEVMIGVFPDEGFTAKTNVSAGLFGAGFVFRVKPAQ